MSLLELSHHCFILTNFEKGQVGFLNVFLVPVLTAIAHHNTEILNILVYSPFFSYCLLFSHCHPFMLFRVCIWRTLCLGALPFLDPFHTRTTTIATTKKTFFNLTGSNCTCILRIELIKVFRFFDTEHLNKSRREYTLNESLTNLKYCCQNCHYGLSQENPSFFSYI